MKIVIAIAMLLFIEMTAMAQHNNTNSKDLWTRSVDVVLDDHWRQKQINVPGKGIPDVVDFFRAFAKAYPCEYYDLLQQAMDGDQEVRFCGEKPSIEIDKDSCYLRNESFCMRVFYENDKPVALGVCCHKAITTKLQDAYYYLYNNASRKLTPLAQGSDFTGGILKRETIFSVAKGSNETILSHRWGRCNIESRLVWNEGKFVLKDPTKENLMLHPWGSVTKSVFNEVIQLHEMEARWPREQNLDPDICGGTFNSLPICIAILDKRSKDDFVAASAMEGFYSFRARGWQRPQGDVLVAFYTECAPENDYGWNEADELVATPHQLTTGDDVMLNFYLCPNAEMACYLDPQSEAFATIVGKGLPDLDRNEWRCVISPENDKLVFVNQNDGHQKVFEWDGVRFKAQ